MIDAIELREIVISRAEMTQIYAAASALACFAMQHPATARELLITAPGTLLTDLRAMIARFEQLKREAGE
jgi:hypothetical protein